MTITAERFTKDGLVSVLSFGMGGGQYWVTLDAVLLKQSMSNTAVYTKLHEARKMLSESGWVRDTTPAFVGR